VRPKASSYALTGFDGTPTQYQAGKVTEETTHIDLQIGRYSEKLQFDLTALPECDVVLGRPWLMHANPMINWKTGQIQFPGWSKPWTLPVAAENTARLGMEISAMTHEELLREIRENPEQVQICYVKSKDDGTTEVTLPKAYAEYADVFHASGQITELPPHQPWDHEIKIKPGEQPTKQKMYPLSAEKLEILRKYLDDGLKTGIIRRSKSPAGYPILFVPKKNNKLRLCVDYRKLNDITIKNSYPLPLIEELQDRLGQAKWFTKFDIVAGYNNIRIKQGDEWKTAFCTRYGLYEYLVMPFGLTNAPATFQAHINNVLREHLDEFVTVYLDDILIYSETLEEHEKHVKIVLELLKKARLPVDLQKSEFSVQETEFLGYIVSKDGLRMSQEKIKTILEWPPATSVKEVQSFLGFANFYRKFIKGYSQITHPLSEATKKDRPFQWTQEMQEAFHELKQRFTTKPILRIFDPAKPIVIETDASNWAEGATLSQPQEDKRLHPIAYHSRKFTGPEQRYDVADKELLAIVSAMKRWTAYLDGAKHEITVLTDHQNLKTFTTTKKLSPRQMRWWEELSRYNFRIHYRKGTENARADALSRRADYQEDNSGTDQQLLKTNPDGSLTVFSQEIRMTQVSIEEDDYEVLIAQTRDPLLKSDKHPYTQEGGAYRWQGKLYVSPEARDIVMLMCHDSKEAGHPGIGRTIARIVERYYFPGMYAYVKAYIQRCQMCQLAKAKRHLPYGELQPLAAPSKPWESVTMDFITGLPKSGKQGYDTILVIVDRFSKFSLFIPTHSTAGTERTAELFLERVVTAYDTPKEIISDRDTLFNSSFWTTVVKNIGINHKFSTAYHPQTDGQTERRNQSLEEYLRIFVNYEQDNWASLLPSAQRAYNTAPPGRNEPSPHELVFGQSPVINGGEPIHDQTENQAAKAKSETMQKVFELCQMELQRKGWVMAQQSNRKKIEGPIFKEGDKVYLNRKNISTKRPSRKLDFKKLGPFRVIQCVHKDVYRLELPNTMRQIHPNFHVSLLEPADPDTPLARQVAPEIEQQEQEYEPEKILGFDGERYLIRWKGYQSDEDTWEPPKHLVNSLPMIRNFHKRDPEGYTTEFRMRSGPSHVCTKNKETFLRSFPLQERRNGWKCKKCGATHQ
jgi:transposase InsO family protein